MSPATGFLIRFDRIALCLLILAVGIARADEPSAPTAKDEQSSQAVELEEIPVRPPEPRFVAPTTRDSIGRIWAPVLIDGKGPYRLVLDTGANHSAVTARTVESLGNLADSEKSARVTGFTGAALVPTIRIDSLEIGNFSLGPTTLPVLADVFGGADGVLSLNGLTRERIFADFAHDRLEIARSNRERPPEGYAALPLRMIRGLPVTSLRVGGVRVTAIIDTGAQLTIGNLALRDALVRHTPVTGVRDDIVGVTLDTQSGDRLPTPDIQLGGLTIRGLNIIFGDMYLFQEWHLTREPTVAIGMDLLGSFDVLIIDYARNEMQLRPRASAQ
jgi:predicted aspartyl protease